MMRFGLCCQFYNEPIKFRTTTARALRNLSRRDALKKLNDIILHNACMLRQALEYCHAEDIRAFRILSNLLPLQTHPDIGYEIECLPAGSEVIRILEDCGRFAQENNIRTSFHPDQFVVLNSPNPEVIERSIADLRRHSELADWLSADVINIHGGGAYGDKKAALRRLTATILRLDQHVLKRLTFENDDKVFTPSDLMPFCRQFSIPFVYDIHHHRCLPDTLSTQEASKAALGTWSREPLFHISSPLEGWDGPKPHRHHDYIDVEDFPLEWLDWNITVDIEAKAKELAVKKIRDDIHMKYERRTSCRSLAS